MTNRSLKNPFIVSDRLISLPAENRLFFFTKGESVQRKGGVVVSTTSNRQKIFKIDPSLRLLETLSSKEESQKLKNYIEDDNTRSVGAIDGTNVIVKGHVQSGKTAFIIRKSLLSLEEGVSTFVVLRNADADIQQFEARVKGFLKLMKAEVSFESSVPMFEFEYKNCTKFFGAKVVVLIANSSQMQMALKCLPGLTDKHNVIVDEGDEVTTGPSGRCKELLKLCEKATKVFYVSATILDLQFPKVANPESWPVFVMPPPKDYLGIDSLVLRVLSLPNSACGRKKDKPFNNDPNLHSFLSNFSEFEPITYSPGCMQPQMLLMNIGAAIEPMIDLFCEVATEYQEILVICYNSDGLVFYHKEATFQEGDISIDGFKSKEAAFCPGAHAFSNSVGLPRLLQWLKDNGGVEKFPRIIIVSGKIASRGISFTNEHFGQSSVDWRLNALYFVPAPLTSQPNLIQSVGRICCVERPDQKITPFLYCTLEVFESVRQAFYTQQEIIERMSQPDFKINTGKLSHRPITTKGIKRLRKENVTSDADGGLDMDTTYRKPYTNEKAHWNKTNREMDEEEQEEDEEEEEEEEEEEVKRSKKSNIEESEDDSFDFEDEGQPVNMDNLEMELSSFNKLTNVDFKRWSSSETDPKIGRFLKNFDCDKEYSKKEIVEAVKDANVQLSDIQVDGKYGPIVERMKGDKYRMYLSLISSFKKWF